MTLKLVSTEISPQKFLQKRLKNQSQNWQWYKLQSL
jgi:hypothetical protein